jgi:hypothetical protein
MADDDPDPGLSVNCPECGDALTFVATRRDSGVHLYACRHDGLFLLSERNLTPIPLLE